ncbi:hypothetical protein PENTCL1PPCAC_2969 [Pristionchus entomophagus]|uniref:Uncharacterized protein n=1 Tax=Pristionchus entomophagus TaxID=358040 RepID=A0AAV5SD87_9BILA|nr:hypothetical protein PENTCL1PPCAC_2969 [Pristionchus entomophagus]
MKADREGGSFSPQISQDQEDGATDGGLFMPGKSSFFPSFLFLSFEGCRKWKVVCVWASLSSAGKQCSLRPHSESETYALQGIEECSVDLQ